MKVYNCYGYCIFLFSQCLLCLFVFFGGSSSCFCFLANCLKGTAHPIIVYTLILSVVLADQSSPTSEAVPPADESLWLLSQIKTFPF